MEEARVVRRNGGNGIALGPCFRGSVLWFPPTPNRGYPMAPVGQRSDDLFGRVGESEIKIAHYRAPGFGLPVRVHANRGS